MKLGVEHIVKREVVLTDEEVEQLHKDMVNLWNQKEKVLQEQAAEKKKMRNRVGALDDRIGKVAGALSSGKEERELTVVWRLVEEDPGIAELIDLKTRRPLERRPLDPDERQTTIDDFLRPPAVDGTAAADEDDELDGPEFEDNE